MTVELDHMYRIKQKLIESGSKVFSWNDRLKLLEMIEMEIEDLLEEIRCE